MEDEKFCCRDIDIGSNEDGGPRAIIVIDISFVVYTGQTKRMSEDKHGYTERQKMKIDSKYFKIAYKKLKSSLYYDKTQIILRDKLVEFEAKIENIDKYMEELSLTFNNTESRGELIKNILSSISYYLFPKSLKQDENIMIMNYSKNTIEIKDNQYFINMDIRGHILGVLWLILIGYRVDRDIYQYSYGNRIRKNLYNELSDNPTYSPYLFEPYFQQYESWRDKAMDEAMQHLHSGQDVVVLTLDFQRFYYSVDISEEFMEDLYNKAFEKERESDEEELRALNNFVYEVILQYASQINEFAGLHILPIGFLPSNILANHALRNFDQAILDGWNPIYFGRYVDDVIVVDKIENKSDLYERASTGVLQAEDVIAFFLEQCSGWRGLNGIECENKKKYALLQNEKIEPENGDKKYVLNKLYNPMPGDNSKIIVKNEKVKIFYFKSSETDALITCFKDSIAKNKSEFRHMPEDEAVFQKDDYSEIYDLQNNETINKFRGITGISIDKFELSKLLGKHLRIGGLIDDVRETGFENQIEKIFNQRVIIENYNVWEKVIEILVINESFEVLHRFLENIEDAIQQLTYKETNDLHNIIDTLYSYLNSALCRSLALVWGKEVDKFIQSLSLSNSNDYRKYLYMASNEIDLKRKAYCKTKMIDKSVMPIFVDMLQIERIFSSDENVNLTRFAQMLTFCKAKWTTKYYYYPFMLTMYDFSMIACVQELNGSKQAFEKPDNIYNTQISNYVKINYRLEDNIQQIKQFLQVERFKANTDKTTYIVSVDNKRKNKLRIAIANVRLRHDNFERVVKEKPNRSYQRYRIISKIINEAINEHADMIIMPEAFMPFEWLTTVARTCARNNLALITGVEHIKIGEKIFNLTAVILPYNDLVNKSAYISFHLKTHYAPAEKQEINGYRLEEIAGNHYELYKWHDCYFPVYCCYELTSINERAIFQSYADFLVAIEWNKDIHYYSNILESLSRDIHCYCVQVNSSDYGDSRITKPSKTEEKDMVRTKGGINSTILVDEIDISKMRDFQLKGYELQSMDKRFKPTPPGFDPDIVLKKIKGDKLI